MFVNHRYAQLCMRCHAPAKVVKPVKYSSFVDSVKNMIMFSGGME